MLIDLRSKDLTGKQAEAALGKADITVNKNMVPFDDKSPFVTSGMRLGTPAITTRGVKEDTIKDIVRMMDDVLSDHENESRIEEIKQEVKKLMTPMPLFAWWAAATFLLLLPDQMSRQFFRPWVL
jgi:glycine hydroxymethyltransferase